ncbi:hypothetical protein LPJ61_006982 [Coemansia biformis]|uniref:Uncharacterized protein n=1 Tax=Coemansia biformis TaxID=1286918 RepID=A0A9W7XRF6_9FUNG|nr:hypothetical protein LPJ61_006982 [Coemansia biformis]
MAMSMYGGIPGMAFDNGMLWEARTPFPNQFPLHVKDTRKVIDTTSMASMVLDRHNFCYRFQLGTNRMRWMAKRARKHQLVLHCLVRNTLVAEIFVDYEKGYSPYNMLSLMKQSAGFGSGSTSGVSTPMEIAANARNAAQNVGAAADLPEDGSLPVVTILPALFDQLSEIDADVVESFAIFTGMQTLECLHI